MKVFNILLFLLIVGLFVFGLPVLTSCLICNFINFILGEEVFGNAAIGIFALMLMIVARLKS